MNQKVPDVMEKGAPLAGARLTARWVCNNTTII